MIPDFKVKLLALRLLGDHYNANAEGKSSSEFFSGFESLPQEMIEVAQQSFPYYRQEDLKKIFADVVTLARQHLPLAQLSSFMTQRRFRRSLESITSNVLMHFVPKAFIERVLLCGYLAPTVIEYREYEPSHFGCTMRVPGGALEFTSIIRRRWEQSNTNLIKARENIGSAPQLPDLRRGGGIELPFVSCFTEIPIEAIEFHAEHYGFFGIAFRKSHLLDGERFQIVRPVAYLDACQSSVIPLLLAAIEKSWQDIETRMRLLRDLFLTKPHHKLGFYPENAFSTFYEREWRYVSYDSWFCFDPKDIEFITVPSKSLTSLADNALKENGSVNQAAWTEGHTYKEHEGWVGYRVLEVAEQLGLSVISIPSSR
jgi:hypothetical protein